MIPGFPDSRESLASFDMLGRKTERLGTTEKISQNGQPDSSRCTRPCISPDGQGLTVTSIPASRVRPVPDTCQVCHQDLPDSPIPSLRSFAHAHALSAAGCTAVRGPTFRCPADWNSSLLAAGMQLSVPRLPVGGSFGGVCPRRRRRAGQRNRQAVSLGHPGASGILARD